MTEPLGIHTPLLVNTLGHTAGILIFGGFLYLFLRSRRDGRDRGFWLSALAASLALLWNLGSLFVLATLETGSPQAGIVVSLSFSVLSLLPAVLLQISLEGRFRPVWLGGYGLGILAAFLHFREPLQAAERDHELAIRLITIGFGVLTLLSVLLISRQGARGWPRSRVLGSMSLFLFAASFAHFGSGHAGQAWIHELAFHHAGIPLALFVLLQDYRFLLLDVFVRFLAGGLLAAALTVVIISLNSQLGMVDWVSGSGFDQALLVLVLCALLITFGSARSRVETWLSRVAFARMDLPGALQAIRGRATEAANEAEFLQRAAAEVGRFSGALQSALLEEGRTAIDSPETAVLPALVADRSPLRASAATRWAEVVVPLRFSQGDTRYILLGRRRGGRRFLSEDLAGLAKLAVAVVEQVERLRRSELERLVSQAELRALRAQVNPHFLFNSLNALYGVIPREAGGARKTVLNLAEIFRYSLLPDARFIALAEELRIIEAYLEIEQLRLGERLRSEIEVDDAVRDAEIPILSVQPLVENAVKHGISRKAEGGTVRLTVQARDGELCVEVSDTGVGFDSARAVSREDGAGHGLMNVRRRLHLCYGDAADLAIESNSGGSRVSFRLPRLRPAQAVSPRL
jgi:hypothetical protein